MQAIIASNLLWTEGIYIVYVLCAALLVGFFISRTLLWSALGLFIFSFYFFRNPDRACAPALKDPAIVVAPADGMVVDIQYPSKQHDLAGFAQRVSIFLSPIDVHVQWAPMAGIIEKIRYVPGDFTFAFLPKSSERNEHNDVLITAHNKKIMVRQIAGTIVRRISCWVKEGMELSVCQKYGMIRFGSRVDVYMPSEVQLTVGVGQKVVGGQTILGRWHNGISNAQTVATQNEQK